MPQSRLDASSRRRPRSLTYVVVRKRGEALEHPGDGTRIPMRLGAGELTNIHQRRWWLRWRALFTGSLRSSQAVLRDLPRAMPCSWPALKRMFVWSLANREVELWWSLPRDDVGGACDPKKQGGPPTSHQDGYRSSASPRPRGSDHPAGPRLKFITAESLPPFTCDG